jgi:uncharacterized peroxidase-related enzyme
LFFRELGGTRRLARNVFYAWLPDCIAERQRMSEAKNPSRIQQLDPDGATRAAKRLFDDVKAKFGVVPNVFRVLGNAPAALESYLHFRTALAGGILDDKVREQIALTVAEANLCGSCLNAHMFIGGKTGLTQKDIADAIHASAAAGKTDAILKLARSIVVQRGEISDSDLQRARAAGLTDGEIVETVANVALNIFENYMSHVARVPIDFPQSQSRETSD